METRKSSVYWLEFKNDEEFPGPNVWQYFRGSAHKFGLFRRKETGQWVEGSVKSEKNISEADAIVAARKHRDQLLSGELCSKDCLYGADDGAYFALQTALTGEAPDICRLAGT